MMNYARVQRRLTEDSYLKDAVDPKQKGNYLIALGTRDGRVLVFRIGTNTPYSFTKLLETKANNAYGAITSIDVVTSPS
jgi:hypothetical protein